MEVQSLEAGVFGVFFQLKIVSYVDMIKIAAAASVNIMNHYCERKPAKISISGWRCHPLIFSVSIYSAVMAGQEYFWNMVPQYCTI